MNGNASGTHGRSRRRAAAWPVFRPPSPVLLVALALALAACGGEVSTAGNGEVSTAGTFDDMPDPDAPLAEVLYPGLADATLLDRLDADFSPAQTLGYDRARDVLYARENDAGTLCGIYSGFCVTLTGGDESAEAARLGVNAEHVWPQSMGARGEPLKSDLHHLFPARDVVNSSRGNLPFGEVPDARAEAWYRGDQSQSNAPRDDVDAWAERGAGFFEPPEARKGDVARAVFYAVALFPEAIEPSFFATMRDDLLAWNRADPPDDAERARSRWVASLQGTENPFVVDYGLAERAWGGTPAGPAPPPVASDLRIAELHYDNAGPDADEGVEVAGPAGTVLDGWTLVFVNGDGGRVYDEVALSGTLPASGAVWTPVDGIQNGSPDGVALVGPGGRVAEFLSYEGVVTATDGPAAGTRSTDLGVAQASDTPPGTTLHRRGGRWILAPASPGR